jgi:hypothetical protein
MRRAWGGAALAAGILAAVGWWQLHKAQAQPTAKLQWIWFDEGKPAVSAPAATRYFRKVFAIDRDFQRPVDEAELDITADNAFTVWVNGTLIGKGDDWKRVYRFDVQKHLKHGKNIIAVEARNDGGAAGLLVRLGFVPNGLDKRAVYSDATWKASKTAADGWQKADFDDKGWPAVQALGPYGQAGPWQGLVWDAGGGDERFTVPEGFRVERAVKHPAGDEKFSLVNMCFDAKGRLLVSRESGPILLCTDPDAKGVLQTVRTYCTQHKN